jgi:hypothetical protein
MLRWRDGLPEKLGGWKKFYNGTIGSRIQALNAWTSLNNVNFLAVGAASSLNVIANNALTNLTPQTLTTNSSVNFSTVNTSATVTIVDTNINSITTFDTVFLATPVAIGGIVLFGTYAIQSIVSSTSYTIKAASVATSTVNNAGAVPSFTTTASSANVTVTLTAHGLIVGSTLNFPIATTVGGLTIQGNYTVTSVTDANNFVISTSGPATSNAGPTSMNSGNAQFQYLIGLGPISGGSGWGTGGWGTGGWGNSTGSGPQTGTPVTATDWTITNWGEDLIACPKGGGIYFWPPESGYQTAVPIPTAPPFNAGIMVAMPQQILVAWGSTANLSLGSSQDPLLVKWSNAGDFTNWTPSTSDLAGSFRIPRGSTVIGGFQSSFRTLLFTDVEAYAMDYIGFPLVFAFNKVGNNCGLIARPAVAELGGIVFWMGQNNFFALSGGGVQPVRCPVWDAVFQDLDTSNSSKVVAASNSAFNEVWWFYPSLSGGTGDNDSYVKYNLVDQAWDYGKLPRTAWLDVSILGTPIAAGTDQNLYQHEQTNDAAGSPISPSFTTGYFSITEGHDIVFLDWFLPDMRFGLFNNSPSASVQFSFSTIMYTGDTPVSFGPYTVTSTTEFIPLRFRARFVSVTVSSNDTGSFWRLGRPRFRYAIDGKR